jgi:hypothetical protein
MDDVSSAPRSLRYRQEEVAMMIKSKVMPFFAAGILLSSVAARADAIGSDPNLAPSTAGEEAQLPGTPANRLQTGMDPDPNVAPSTAGEEAQIAGTPPNTPETATEPDPNIAPSTTGEEEEIQSGTIGHGR